MKTPPPERSRCPYHEIAFHYDGMRDGQLIYICRKDECHYELSFDLEPESTPPKDEPSEHTLEI
jgi:hypothetical protein